MTEKLCTNQRLPQVEGLENKFNDVIFAGILGGTPSTSDVIFFGGDVQDYKENMLNHRDNHRHSQWNLEDTASLLHRRFPTSHIWVIKPSKMNLKIFSIFSNFVESNDVGSPSHSEGQDSWEHLHLLLKSAKSQISRQNSACHSTNNLCTLNINDNLTESLEVDEVVLIGFSKGCIVLNQFLYDLKTLKIDSECYKFTRNVRQIYWLDGGHCGGSNTWIVHFDILSNLVTMDISVVVHMTPYQVNDDMRKWIGKEQRKFVERLKRLGVNVSQTLHFEDQERSIENHFKLLSCF